MQHTAEPTKIKHDPYRWLLMTIHQFTFLPRGAPLVDEALPVKFMIFINPAFV